MVLLLKTTQELLTERNKDKIKVGFVPTMGNLHAGHISLLKRALSDYDVVYFSIFVNPKQFGPQEDFNRYPRTLEQDLALIEALEKEYQNKKVIVFAPARAEEIYPPGFAQTVSVRGDFTQILEGAIRPGHFDGVSTVVFQLFDLIKPQEAYFGLKDYQQYLVIKHMVNDLLLPIKITGMPIIREASGLALSSRNQYLSEQDKIVSLTLSKTLLKLKQLIDGKKENLEMTHQEVKQTLKDKNWNYLEIRDADTLSTDLTNSKEVTILAVYQLGTTRLLDNLQVTIS
jgi:pantoate--beta-alanine ligase